MTNVERQFLEFVFLAYAAVFILIFLFVTYVWRRTRSLERDLAALRDEEAAEGES